MPFKPRPKEWGAGHVRIGGRNNTGWENTMCKSLEEGKNFLCVWRTENIFFGCSWVIKREIGDSQRTMAEFRVYFRSSEKPLVCFKKHRMWLNMHFKEDYYSVGGENKCLRRSKTVNLVRRLLLIEVRDDCS